MTLYLSISSNLGIRIRVFYSQFFSYSTIEKDRHRTKHRFSVVFRFFLPHNQPSLISENRLLAARNRAGPFNFFPEFSHFYRVFPGGTKILSQFYKIAIVSKIFKQTWLLKRVELKKGFSSIRKKVAMSLNFQRICATFAVQKGTTTCTLCAYIVNKSSPQVPLTVNRKFISSIKNWTKFGIHCQSH